TLAHISRLLRSCASVTAFSFFRYNSLLSICRRIRVNQLLSRIVVAGVLPLLFAGAPAHNPRPGSVSSQGQLHTIEAPCNVKWISVPYHGVTFVLVPPKLSKECLIAQAKSLNKKTPNSRFEFFDAKGGTLNEYVAYYDACDRPLNLSRCDN